MTDNIAKFWQVFFSGYCNAPERYVIYYQRYCRYFPEERITDEKTTIVQLQDHKKSAL
jgi:hypothetical protein